MKTETFTKAIYSIRNQMELDNEFAKNMSLAFSNAFAANLLYDNRIIIDAMIELLVTEMNDKDTWIEYFIYELDFGLKNKDVKVYDKDENEIPLSNASELYEILTK